MMSYYIQSHFAVCKTVFLAILTHNSLCSEYVSKRSNFKVQCYGEVLCVYI